MVQPEIMDMDTEFTVVRKRNKRRSGGTLLIDVSSIVFLEIFRLRNKFKSGIRLDSNTPDTMNAYILKYFGASFVTTIRRLVEQYKTRQLVLARDVCKENLWRTKKYAPYKANRKRVTRHKNETVSLGPIFYSIYRDIYDKLVDELGAISLIEHNAEADDVIAVLAKYLSAKAKRVVIVANDSDYYQLLVHPGVEIYDHLGNNYANNDRIKKYTPQQFLLLKILLGDKTDNIPPCQLIVNRDNLVGKMELTPSKIEMFLAIGLFQKKWINRCLANKIIENNEILTKLLTVDPIFRESYLRNLELIDMDYIPVKIQTNILQQYNAATQMISATAAG